MLQVERIRQSVICVCSYRGAPDMLLSKKGHREQRVSLERV